MEPCTVALFGEAERGEFETAYFCSSLEQLMDQFGHPPLHSRGLDYAVQTLLFHHHLIFFRVREEGFSEQDYYKGLNLLKNQVIIPQINAICIPGVGNNKIIEAMVSLCIVYHSIIITTESDLYDYLTQYSAS